MSTDKLREQGERWLLQATDDFESASLLHDATKFATAGFLYQQAAEKAVKAIGFAADTDPWGHSVSSLIADLPGPYHGVLASHGDAAKRLDKLYIPTRYPDALPELVPAQAYTKGEADDARRDAEAILSAVRGWFAAAR